jgi:hypothetical protein
MAITIVTQPQAITPAYNDNFVTVSSTNKTKAAFRYIAELFVNNVKVTAFKITPEFGTNNGKQVLNELIAGYLSHTLRASTVADLLSGSVNFLNGINLSNVLVKIQWGEEYIPDPWAFSDYEFPSNWTNISNPAINPTGLTQTQLKGATEPDYVAGDFITVSQTAAPTASNYRIELEGSFLVLDVFQDGGLWYVVLDLPWIGSGAASPGTTQYSDGRKTIDLNEFETNTYRFINTAVPFHNYPAWTGTDYVLDGTTKKFLTSLPRSKPWRVRPDSLVFIQGFRPAILGLVEFRQGGATTASYVLPTANVLYLMDASPRKLPTLSDEYGFRVLGASETLRFKIDQKCYGFDDVEIVFMDRFGSFLPIQFMLRRSQNIDVKRDTYKKDVTTATMYQYKPLDGGEEDLFIEVGKTYTLRSDRMTVEESEMMEQLVSSPFTIVRFGDDPYVRCTVKTSSIDIKDEYFEGLRFYDIDIEITNKDVVNW